MSKQNITLDISEKTEDTILNESDNNSDSECDSGSECDSDCDITQEQQEKFDNWLSGQLLANEMKEILDKINFDPAAPPIEKFKMNVDQYGFLHGYYLKAV